jgi:hypothetical protein
MQDAAGYCPKCVLAFGGGPGNVGHQPIMLQSPNAQGQDSLESSGHRFWAIPFQSSSRSSIILAAFTYSGEAMDSNIKEPLISAFEELKWLHASVAELRGDFLSLQQFLVPQTSAAKVAFQKIQEENRAGAALAISSGIQEFDEIIGKLKAA